MPRVRRSATVRGESTGAAAAPGLRMSRGIVVTVATVVALLLSLAGVWAGASTWQGAVERQDRSLFREAAADVAASMASALRRDTDFMAAMRATVATRSSMTNAEYRQWIALFGAGRRFPGGVGYAYLLQATPAEVPAVSAVIMADPPATANKSRTFSISPAGRRSVYCFFRLSYTDLPIRLPVGFDACSSGIIGLTTDKDASAHADGGATGEFSIRPLDVAHGLFWIAAPVYRGGDLPESDTARVASMLGWVAGTFDGAAIITDGGQVRPGMRVEIQHVNPGEAPITLASSGSARPGGWTSTIQVQANGDWVVRVTGVLHSGGPSARTQFWIIIVLGSLFALGAFVFVQVLIRSRQRAMALVERRTRELRHQATHDALTGLPNRVLILQLIDEAMARARRTEAGLAVLFIDLDGFKNVNDTYGHAVGDEFLRLVSLRLVRALRDGETLGRLGGDEFVVLVERPGLPNLSSGEVAERLLAALVPPLQLGGAPGISVRARASIGVAQGVRPDPDQLLRDADTAMYEAKVGGQHGFAVFSSRGGPAAEPGPELAEELRRALGSGELSLLFRPVFEPVTGQVVAAGAEPRWRNPRLGVLNAAEFLPAAQECGLALPVGHWVLSEACRQAAAWARAGHPIAVCVPLDGRHLETGEVLVEDLRAVLDETRLPARSLILTLPRTTLGGDPSAISAQAEVIRELGVRLAVGGLEGGLPALAELSRMPVDAIIADRGLLEDLSAAAEALFRALVEVGRALGIQVLAQGCPKPEKSVPWPREGFDQGRGCLLSRAETGEEVLRLIQALRRSEPVRAGSGESRA